MSDLDIVNVQIKENVLQTEVYETVKTDRDSLEKANSEKSRISAKSDSSICETSLSSETSKQGHSYPDSPVSVVESSDSNDVPVKNRRKRRSGSNLQVVKKSSRKEKSNDYEVEFIEDYVEYGGDAFYLVKWKGWGPKYNSWVPKENMNCTKIIDKYFSSVYGSYNITKENIDAFGDELLKPNQESLVRLMSSLTQNSQIKYDVPKLRNVCMSLSSLLSIPQSIRNTLGVENVKRDLLLRCFHVKRLRQLKLLKEWEDEINASSLSGAPITVENEVDLEGPPENFYYVNEYIPGPNVSIPEEPPIGCSCKTCTADSCSCVKESGGNFAYRTDGTVQVSSRIPIYECNKSCSCSEKCTNRVIQKGCKVRLSIFRTSTGCGWGVKALEDIRKGTFICEYVGEVINSEEAEERGRKYDTVGQTYLFDLDYNDRDHCPYTVDAAFLGNIAHFINHSCSPNLTVYAVWINCLDPDLPKLALFARKNIQKEDEITFDYMSQAVNPRPSSSKCNTLCKCGSTSCRKYLF